MTARELIELAAFLLVLGGFLYLKYWQRVLSRAERDHWTAWTGSKAFDATDLNKTMKQVRGNYLAARPRPKGGCFHRTLLAFARYTVARLPYFHDREQEHRT